jgi:RNA-directed DNA polymerase
VTQDNQSKKTAGVDGVKSEPNSYGFRPGRSCHDALAAIFVIIAHQAKYVLDADLKGAFDNINHEALLKKLNTYPALRRAIKAWLKAGVIDNGSFEETPRGPQQGGVASPLLLNIALHGMETALLNAYRTKADRPQFG